jgi:hypothetical protein
MCRMPLPGMIDTIFKMNFQMMFYIPFLRHLAQVRDAVEKYEAAERAAKDAWREREGWATAEEARILLSGEDGVHFELLDE